MKNAWMYVGLTAACECGEESCWLAGFMKGSETIEWHSWLDVASDLGPWN